MSKDKTKKGQFYTIRNPFNHPLVRKWFSLIPNPESKLFVEPFGGANNIIALFEETFPEIKYSQWRSYDLDPEAISENRTPEVELIKQDTIKNPVDADVVITNPPYLAKNSAKRMGLDSGIDFENYQDLYEVALDRMLAHTDYLAAIIPESFLTRKLFRERLYGFISITENLFDDTDFPVGVGLWTKEEQDDYEIWLADSFVGKKKDIIKQTSLFSKEADSDIEVRFNDPQGILGVYAVDGTVEPTIRFIPGKNIPSEDIKVSSRAITRITVSKKGNPLITEENLEQAIKKLNKELALYRQETFDVFMTAFKGLRKDGRYRRRLDFKTIKNLIQIQNWQ